MAQSYRIREVLKYPVEFPRNLPFFLFYFPFFNLKIP